MAKINLDTIKTQLAAEGWKVLAADYTNLDTVMEFECPEGHRVHTTWKKLRTKLECPICKNKSHSYHSGESQAKPKGVTRVLALDQASHVSGYAIFDNDKLVAYGSFEASGRDEVERYLSIKSWLLSLISTWRPDHVGIEGIQFQEEGGGQKMGVTVFQTLARLQGVLLLTCHEERIPCEVCPTNTWRHHCGVKGKTRTDKKRSMQILVKKWYDVTVTDDESDAIGIGRYVSQSVTKQTLITNWET